MMNFFSKKNNKDVPQPPSAEERGTDMIVENTEPNAYPKRNPRILNSTQLQRVMDAKRLAESKLQGLEERLSQLQAQQQWLRRYKETQMALEREKKRLFELGKQKAILAKDAEMLDRYDLFEGIHGIYQKLSVLKEQIGQDKRGLSILEREADENRQKMTEQEKRQQQSGESLKTAKSNLQDVFDRVYSASQISGTIGAIDAEMAFLSDYYNKMNEEMNALSSLTDEKESNILMLQKELEWLTTRRQSMEMHENMIRHGEEVLMQLNSLRESAKLHAELQQQRQQAIRRQNEENEMLGKTFAQHQDIISQEETAEAELSMHRSYILGQDGLMLQERALMLKGRRQQLLSALSLWKRISSGYESIEERSRKVTALRQHIQHLDEGVRKLEAEAGKAYRLCKEKEYTYLLSKGQDVIQLRGDLREGTACSVCGATHHPYHSDTILDQSKLISEMKTDYDLLASEANAKQQQLSEMQAELATVRGQLSAEEEALNSIRIRQNEDVQEWNLYAELDPTFAECSESTNLEARTAMLRQFIENVSRDAARAEKELEAFTFHQSSIARLGEELQKLEQKENEISVRLNELNTGLQVLTRDIEQISQRHEDEGKQFSRIYENMQLLVTLKDWYSIWQNSPEKICEKIQKLMSDWFSVEKDIASKQADLDVEKANLEGLKAQLRLFARATSVVRNRLEQLQNIKAENIKSYEHYVPDRDALTFYKMHQDALHVAQEQYDKVRNETDDIRSKSDVTQGRHDYYLEHITRLEGEQRQLGEKLDLWMHAFNLQHPPVRMDELDKVFADGKDWSKIRSSMKQINTDMLLCQAKVDDLNSRIIALETEDGHCSPSSPDIQENIAAKQQSLTKQRSETMMQIARLSVQLEDHEKAVVAERNSAEPT